MSNFKQSEFIHEDDCIISAECEDCGNSFEADDDCGECPECESQNLIYETSHEGCKCKICGCTFDMYDEAYRHSKDTDILICPSCYDELEEEE